MVSRNGSKASYQSIQGYKGTKGNRSFDYSKRNRDNVFSKIILL